MRTRKQRSDLITRLEIVQLQLELFKLHNGKRTVGDAIIELQGSKAADEGKWYAICGWYYGGANSYGPFETRAEAAEEVKSADYGWIVNGEVEEF